MDSSSEPRRIAPLAAPNTPAAFATLVNGNGAEPRLVYEAACQLFYEEQVRLLWVMYNCFSTTAGVADANPPASE